MPKIVKILGESLQFSRKPNVTPLQSGATLPTQDEDTGCIYSRSNDAGIVIGRVERAGPTVYHGH